MESPGSMSRFIERIIRYVILVSSVVLAVIITAFVFARIFGVLLQVFSSPSLFSRPFLSSQRSCSAMLC